MNDLTFIQLRRGHEEDRRRFESLMVPYFRELDRHQGRHTDPEFLRNVTRSILSMQGPHDRHLELCYDGDSLVGFWYGKVDHPEHKGFIKPGYGYIMEFYVIPAYRRQGSGTAMFRRLHGLFASHGVKRLYLTADPVTGKPFWEWIGFQNTGERSPENGLSIYEMGIGNWPSETARSLPVRADPASPGHAVWLDRLYTQSRERLHGPPISLPEWRKVLSAGDPDERNYILSVGGMPAAWLRVNGLLDPTLSGISMLVVDEGYRRQGVGRYVVTFAEETIRSKGKARVRLHTTEDNLPARRLYRSCGYIVRECGERMGGDGQKRRVYTFEKDLIRL